MFKKAVMLLFLKTLYNDEIFLVISICLKHLRQIGVIVRSLQKIEGIKSIKIYV